MLNRIPYPELFFGIVAPIGTDISPTVELLAKSLTRFNYQVRVIKVTDIFDVIKKVNVKRVQKPLLQRYKTFIKFGNAVRKKYEADDILAALTIAQISLNRKVLRDGTPQSEERVAYIVHQFKRKEEIELFRSTYGRLFFQVSVYSSRKMRTEYLSRKFADDADESDPNRFRGKAEDLIRDDENEQEIKNGQRLRQVFHLADFIINKDSISDERDQIDRFIDLLFGSNSRSPTKPEYAMYIAKSASLRTLDLSRQVGAAIFSEQGEIISLGSNEVPKGGGGSYWCDDPHDDRDYKRKEDPNEKIKRQNVVELLSRLERKFLKKGTYKTLESIFRQRAVQDSKIMESLEYGRIIHAEMSAITDAARLGRNIKGAILYSTTFPCHICTKHIVASGMKSVVFLEPYPKSHAFDLHYDSIRVEGDGSAEHEDFPKTDFVHFSGIAPRRFRDFFEKSKRKDSRERFLEWGPSGPRPIYDMRLPVWCVLEAYVAYELPEALLTAAFKMSQKIKAWTPETEVNGKN